MEYGNLLDHRSKWEEPVLIRFIRLQGKRLVQSVYDPVLHSIFLAWDVLVPNYAKVEWESFQEEKPITDPACNRRLQWREIAPRPRDGAEAWAVLSAIVAEHVGRLKELLAQNQAIEAIEDPTWADRAAMDAARRSSGTGGTSRPRRGSCCGRWKRCEECGMGNAEYRLAALPFIAATRFHLALFIRLLEFALGHLEFALRHLAFVIRHLTFAIWLPASAICLFSFFIPHSEFRIPRGGCDEEQSSEPMAEGSSGPVAGRDSNPAIDDSTNDTMGISSHEGRDAADGVRQGDGLEQSLACGVKTPQKAPNEAKLESMQSTSSLGVESRNTETAGRERSQSAAAWLLAQGAGSDRVEPIAGGQGRREGSGPQRSFAAKGRLRRRRFAQDAEAWVGISGSEK